MKSSIKKVAIIGSGVIGTGWILRLIANNIKVFLYEPKISQKEFLFKEIKRTEKNIKKFYNIKKFNLNYLSVKSSIKDAVKNADLIQENCPENIKIKKIIVKEISRWSNKKAIIASSSSGLLPSKIQKACDFPERFVIAHPFNPVYLLPLVEIVRGNLTSTYFTKKADNFYKSIGMKTIILKKEVEGYLSDRLQEAVWRESLHILKDDLASTEDLDDSITYGPGLRWSYMGVFLTFHFDGGKQGMKHMLEQFGPALKLPWTKLKAPKLTKKLSNKIIKETKKQANNLTINQLSTKRDNFLIDLLKLKNKHNI